VKFVDIFSGLGGFHLALEALGGECAFAVELDSELRDTYKLNFGMTNRQVESDIAAAWSLVPRHDVLCAGFPCQPFSKSGSQKGFGDATRGTLFHYLLKIIAVRKPKLVVLENVGNFARHDDGNTWRVVRESLVELGYDVRGTEHMDSGGHGLLSPHHFGFPQVRERFFAVAARDGFRSDPIPVRKSLRRPVSFNDVAVNSRDLSELDRQETALSPQQVHCIELWSRFTTSVPLSVALPSFPIWSDEFGAQYSSERYLGNLTHGELTELVGGEFAQAMSREDLLALLPSYTRNGTGLIPHWKRRFMEQNREYYEAIKRYLPRGWLDEIRRLPPSLRKLEWNCQGEDRNLWNHILQFRPSGLRVKRIDSSPALVAMTTTQIPIYGPERRFISRIEGLRIQGMPDEHLLPASRIAAFRALGNAVHVGVVHEVYKKAIRNLRNHR